MRSLFWVGVVVGLALWIVGLQRRVQRERRRGDMFRDAAVRLEQRGSGQLERER
jgi:hypothetical protein